MRTIGWRRRTRRLLIVFMGISTAVLIGDYAGVLPIRAMLFAAWVPRLRAEPMTLVTGVHMLGGLSPSVVYVVETSRGLLLFDSGLQRDAAELRREMIRLKLDWRKICAIFLTHVHGDHSGGADFLRAATKAKIYAGEGDTKVLRAGAPRDAFFSTFYMPWESTHPTEVDEPLVGGETLTFGDVRVLPIATPGHTPGSMCYLIVKDHVRAFVAGDIVMKLHGDAGSPDELDKPLGTYAAYLCPRYRGDADDLLATLRKLRAMAVPDLVLPGHPTSDQKPQSPCLSRARWHELFDAGIRDMEKLLFRFKTDGADFLDGVPKKLLNDFYYLGDRRGEAVYGFIADRKLFLVNAPGADGDGLCDFVESRLGTLGIEPRKPSAILLTAVGEEETAGLAELVGATRAAVICSPEGIPRIKRLCPPGTEVISSEDLPSKGWFSVETVPLSGRGFGPIGYLLRWQGKAILLSGRIPIQVTQETGMRLFSDFQKIQGSLREYLGSLAKLQSLSPNLWLPSVPTDGRNANLYDAEWSHLIRDNMTAVERNARILPEPTR